MTESFRDFVDLIDECTHDIEKLEKEKCLQALSKLKSINFQENWFQNENEENVQIASNKLSEIIQIAIIPEFSKREHCTFESSDFCGYPQKTELAFLLLKIILENSETLPESGFRSVICHVLPDLLVLISSNSEVNLWTTLNIVEQSLSISQTLKKIFKGDWDIILFPEGPNSIVSTTNFHKYFKKIKPRLLKHNWMKNPNIQKSFQWMLQKVKFPFLSEFIDTVLPPSLNFVDDFEVSNKCAGVKCLHHIIDNGSREELRWCGRAEVIFDVLEKQMYNHDPHLIVILHPTILTLLPVFGKIPDDIEKHHKVFQMIIRDIEFENKILIRRALTSNLSKFVDILGISVIKHSKKLLSVFEMYLEVFDGPEEISRLNILKTLQQFLSVAWPRVPQYSLFLWKILYKFICDISTDKTTTPTSVKAELISEAQKCLVLIKICDSENSEKFLKTVKSNEMTDFIKIIISQIENHQSVDCLPNNFENIKELFYKLS